MGCNVRTVPIFKEMDPTTSRGRRQTRPWGCYLEQMREQRVHDLCDQLALSIRAHQVQAIHRVGLLHDRGSWACLSLVHVDFRWVDRLSNFWSEKDTVELELGWECS